MRLEKQGSPVQDAPSQFPLAGEGRHEFQAEN